MYETIAPCVFMLLGALVAWYGVYLGRTNRPPVPPIQIFKPRDNGAAIPPAAGKHQETLHARGM